MTLREVIESSPIFRELGERERAALAAAGRLRRVRSGGYLWRVGDHADGLHILLEGLVHIGVVRPDGELIVLHVVAPGDMLGEPGIYAPEGDRRTDGRAVGRVALASFP